MRACVLSRFGRVGLFATPWTVSRQAPQSMGFCRQEYWKVKSEVAQSCPTLCDPVDCNYSPPGSSVRGIVQARIQSTRLLHPWDSPGKNTGVDCHFRPQGIFPTQGSNPGLQQADALTSKPRGKPKSLSNIYITQYTNELTQF